MSPLRVFFLNTVHRSRAAFTLPELLVAVAVLGIVATIAIPSFAFVLRRERVNAIALETAGWLEEARAQSSREVNRDVLEAGDDDSQEGGCVIILGGENANATTGDVIATVESSAPGRCEVRQASLVVPDTQGEEFKIRVFGLGSGTPEGDPLNPCKSGMGMVCSGSVSLFFTPRGMWSSSSIEADQNLEIRIVQADGKGPKRCVRVSSILGSIDIGKSSDGNISTTCSQWGSI